MRERQGRKDRAAELNAEERGAIAEFLTFIEDRVKGAEPVCAKLVRMARLSLGDARGPQDPDRVLH